MLLQAFSRIFIACAVLLVFVLTAAAQSPHNALAVFRYGSRFDKDGRKSIKLRLVEAVDPQEDRFVDMPDDLPLIKDEFGNQTFWILNQHHNAGESYRDYKTIKVQSDKRLQ
jgi:hypothetical protein